MAQSPGAAPRGERFVLGCDHAGYEMKEELKRYLTGAGNDVEDLVPEFEGRTDFPPIAERLARQVAAAGDGLYGILVCGTGIGMSMAANKVPGVRAALLYCEAAAEYARRHNNANVLAFGGRTMTFEQVRSYLEAFFRHEFEGGRYAERNAYMAGMDGALRCR
jgi:ribose 5-phosphate isomerase B